MYCIDHEYQDFEQKVNSEDEIRIVHAVYVEIVAPGETQPSHFAIIDHIYVEKLLGRHFTLFMSCI